ncbi:mitochondrial substrate carrier family protein [Reticulomyxa filosa]|uniref:Mitochondrial substrate carrier family protein n=1 Tax=Reticulomyxa filosa TaxID=46433 RepID=X6P6C6_RETFI|nr:mitochondrial substrate carrier family protein [Reticulomyxa filosa]|eukprot:ETO33668.1 mitochondrial substrate carrier family protein [Reticulomyxa filosa]
MKQHLPLLRSLSGSLASATTTLITHPLDTVNVRIVTQYRVFHYTNVAQTLKDIAKQEDVRALYKGLPLTLFGTVLRGGMGFGIYETTKSHKLREWHDHSFLSNLAHRLLLGFMAGAITTTICYPVDTIRRYLKKNKDDNKYLERNDNYRILSLKNLVVTFESIQVPKKP